MSEPDQRSDVTEGIRRVQRAAGTLAARLKPLASVRGGSSNALRDLDRALQTLGEVGAFATALEDTVRQGADLVRAGRAQQAENLRLAVNGFIRDIEPSRARETAQSGWRVGRIALELRPSDGTLRASYNREPITGWLPVAGAADVDRIYREAENQLAKAEIPMDALQVAMGTAYDHLAGKLSTAPGAARRVKLQEVLEEVRVVRARDALRAKRHKDAAAAVAMPPWALLYNADRYRAASAELSPGARLMFEQGTTAEGEKFGVTLNGLEPARDYQRFCYLRRVDGT